VHSGSLWTPLRCIHLPFIPNLLRFGRRYAVPPLREDGEFPASQLREANSTQTQLTVKNSDFSQKPLNIALAIVPNRYSGMVKILPTTRKP
jgi:hypothetical protein